MVITMRKRTLVGSGSSGGVSTGAVQAIVRAMLPTAETGKALGWDAGGNLTNIAAGGGTAAAVKTDATPPAAPALYYWKCADVAFSVPAGTYQGTQSVTLSGGAGETIRYTTDGSDPTSASTEATGAISVASSLTLKARAFKADTAPGDVGSAAYVIEAPAPDETAQPTLDAISTPTKADPIAISGGCESSSSTSVQPYVDGVAHGSPVVVSGSATWTANLSGVAEGARSITVKATASGKTESVASAARAITVDRTAPSAPTITSPAAGTTLSATVDVVFTGEAGGTGVALNGATEYPATEGPAGTYTAAGVPLSVGANSLTAQVTDAAGNVSAASAAVVRTLQTVTRSATGKLFFDDFSGDLSKWTVTGAGHLAVVGGKGKITYAAGTGQATLATASFPSNTGAYVTSKIQMFWTGAYTSDARLRISNAADPNADYYELGVMSTTNTARNTTLGKGVASVRTTLRDWGTKETTKTEHAYAMKVSGGSLQTYLDGAEQGAPAADATFSAFTKVQVTGSPHGNDVDGYVTFDDIAVMKSHLITVSNLPTGWKARCAGVTAAESGGTATLDMSGIAFPQTTIEILNATDTVQQTITLTADVWGGDAFSA